jgi:hypothetical protein
VYEEDYEPEWLQSDPPRLEEIAIGQVASLDDDGVSTYLAFEILAKNSSGHHKIHFLVKPEDAIQVAALIVQGITDAAKPV